MGEKKFLNISFKSIPGIGLIYAFISAVFWSTAGLMSKLADELNVFEIVAISSIIQTIIYFAIVTLKKQPYFGAPNERWHILGRCVSGVVALTGLYLAYRYIEIAEATTLRFTAAVFANGFAYFCLKEPCGILQIVTAIITVIGVVIMGRPPFIFNNEEDTTDSTNRIIGMIIAMVSSITAAWSFIHMRRLQKTHSPVVVLWYSIFGVCVGFIGAVLTNKFLNNEGKYPELKLPTDYKVWIYLIVEGCAASGDQLFTTFALKVEHAGAVGVVVSLSVVFAFIFGAAVLHEIPQWTSFVGAALILGGVFLLGGVKWYHERQKTKEKRKLKRFNSFGNSLDNSIADTVDDHYIFNNINDDKVNGIDKNVNVTISVTKTENDIY